MRAHTIQLPCGGRIEAIYNIDTHTPAFLGWVVRDCPITNQYELTQYVTEALERQRAIEAHHDEYL